MPSNPAEEVGSGGTTEQEGAVAVAAAAAPAPAKKKRNLPGTPDPEAEVIALSPGTLMATNRFVCEVCGKGFQRDQNLQLHRRGHNLPWRLRQRGPGAAPPRRRVYVCPEPGCVHHSPARALGDLTGIKKHFCRKHGEKRWACGRCSKRYAVQADLKAHAKTCGTREYRCDCGTLFTRRDSFVTHRAFCGALGEETGRVLAVPAPPSPPDLAAVEDGKAQEEEERSVVAEVDEPPHQPPPPPPPPPQPPLQEQQQPAAVVATNEHEPEMVTEPGKDAEQEDTKTEKDSEPEGSNLPDNDTPMLPCFLPSPSEAIGADGRSTSGCAGSSASTSIPPARTTSTFAGLFASVTASTTPQSRSLRDLIGVDPTFLCLAIGAPSSLFPQQNASNGCTFAPPPAPHMSATALLQKAAEVGAAPSSLMFLKEFGLAGSSSSLPSSSGAQGRFSDGGSRQWHQQSNQQMELEPGPMPSAGLGLGLTYDNGSSRLPDLMMGPSSALYVRKPATLDFLGLGIGGTMGGATGEGALPALMVGGELDLGPARAPPPWEAKGKSSSHTSL